MKYCVNAKQPLLVIKKADEVLLDWEDREYMPQLIVDAPKVRINLHIPDKANIPFKTIKDFIQEGANIVLRLDNIFDGLDCQKYQIPFYQSKPLCSYWEVNNAIQNGVSEIFIGENLFFDLSTLANFDISIRTIANAAFINKAYINDNGIKGMYIRPEDIEWYEQYIDTLSFYSENLKQEETLLKIYSEDKHWPGNLKKLIYNLKEDVDNRGLPEEFGQVRLNCRQKCMRNKTCHFCERAFLFSQKLDEIAQEQKNV